MTGRVERHVRCWLQEFVVDLNLCPFARPFVDAQNLRIAVCEALDLEAAVAAFLVELDMLQRSTEQEIATTLLVFPRALESFDEYLQFVEDAEDLLTEAGLEGVVQLASFHPSYQFAGEALDAASHYSNRAPYPLIHLLREDMISRVLADFSEPQRIPDRNIETLEGIGVEEMARRWQAIFQR